MKKCTSFLFILLFSITSVVANDRYASLQATPTVSGENVPPQTEEFRDQARREAFEEVDLDTYIQEEQGNKKPNWITRKWLELDKKISLNFLDFDAIDGTKLAGKYKWGVEQSFEKGYYLREDFWEAKARIDLGELVTVFENEEDSDWTLPATPLKFGVEKGARVRFYRQFEEHNQALTAAPYCPFNLPPENPFGIPVCQKRLPTDSQTAIENLSPGDFISMESRMNLFLGFGGAFLDGIFKYSANLLYVLRGNFLVHFYRMPNNKLRMKIFAGNNRGFSGSGSVQFGFEFFEMDLANDLVEELTDFDLFEFTHESPEGKIMVLDYIFDLNNADARAAFDNFINPKFLLKDVDMIKKVFGDGRPIDTVLSDVEMINQIAMEDKDKPAGQKRIEKVFQAYNEYELQRQKFEINLLIFKREVTKTAIENNIIQFTADNGRKYYFSPSFSKRKEIKLDIGLAEWKGTHYDSLFTIFETDPTRTEYDFTDMGVTRENREVTLTPREQIRWIKRLRTNLPEGKFDSVDWKDWRWQYVKKRMLRNCFFIMRLFKDCSRGLETKSNTQIYFQFFINKDGLDVLKGMNQAEYRQKIKTLEFTDVFSGISKERRDELMEKYADRLFRVFSAYSPYDHEKKVKRLKRLRSYSIFKNYAPAFAKALLGEDRVEDLTFYYFKMFALSAAEIKFTIGSDSRDLYNEIRAIDDAINQDDRNSLILFVRDENNDGVADNDLEVDED